MTNGVTDLSAGEVKAKLEAGEIVLVDVRTPLEFVSGHIPGALLFPLPVFDPAKLSLDAGRPYVFYCAGGVRSDHAAQAALPFCPAGTAHLKGGISAWAQEGFAIQSMDPKTGEPMPV